VFFIDKIILFNSLSGKINRFSNNRKFNRLQLIYCVSPLMRVYICLNKTTQIMKTNYYILIILLLSFSYVNAQSNVESKKVESTVMISDNNDNVTSSLENDTTVNTVKEEGKTETIIIEGAVARSSSDIKIYLNRLRNVENIGLLFPEINKVRRA